LKASIDIFALCAAAFTLIGALLYRQGWPRFRREEITPTGFGVLLAPILVAGSLVARAPGEVTAAYGVIAAAAGAYWLDDLIELRASLRILISFAAGVAICALVLGGAAQPPVLIVLCVAAGMLSVVLTNVVNFYDGADLNLATFIALTGGIALMAAPPGSFMRGGAIAILAFIIPFAALNSRPKTIYLGDSGSFAFASFLTLMILVYVRGGGEVPAQAVIPLALPAFDVFFVLGIRVLEKHDLLTRNYLHLYQKLNARYEGFGYLAPQAANTAAVLAGDLLLRKAGLGYLPALGVSVVLLTPITYFSSRALFLRPAAER
jgi:UDP-N-acetylmuramyl pentapeptide phosphotransferase/UDP-N-acetylglucosamine-1-phosphate transferase